MERTGIIYGINGPIVYLKGDPGFKMNELVYVGTENLVGEVIGLTSERTTIEVYEETSGLKPGESVTGSGSPVSVILAPGILTNIFDGIERPLSEIKKTGGAYIDRGVSVESLDGSKLWDTHITVKKGDVLYQGSIFAEVPETRAIVHSPWFPPELREPFSMPRQTENIRSTIRSSHYYSRTARKSSLRWHRNGLSASRAPSANAIRHPGRSLQDSVSWIPCFPWQKAAPPVSPAASAQVKP